MFQMVEQARKSNGDPMELLKNTTSNFSPTQMNDFIKQAKQMGFSEDILNQIQR